MLDDYLAEMRATMLESLPDTAAILYKTSISDGRGGRVVTWLTRATVPCRLTSLGPGTEMETDARIQADTPWILTLPHGTAVTPDNRIAITSADWGLKTLEVTAPEGPRTWEIGLRIPCREVR